VKTRASEKPFKEIEKSGFATTFFQRPKTHPPREKVIVNSSNPARVQNF
jgi:hypothetical protein